MAMDFHAEQNRHAYAGRQAQPDWASAIRAIVDPAGRRVADIGCGGGIYSAAWAELGASRVTGVDFSEQMVRTAQEKNGHRPNLTFRHGDALATGLPSGAFDIVFERALIHHLTDLDACCAEAYRLLGPGGVHIVQDRTPDDVRLAGSPDHIRGYFFDCFPKLLDTELGRRPTETAVENALSRAGFEASRVMTVWETRRRYDTIEDLGQDLLGRVGRSILHHLSDAELAALVAHIGRNLPPGAPIVERDRWTIWSGRKP